MIRTIGNLNSKALWITIVKECGARQAVDVDDDGFLDKSEDAF